MKPILKLAFWVLVLLAAVTFGNRHLLGQSYDGIVIRESGFCRYIFDGSYGMCESWADPPLLDRRGRSKVTFGQVRGGDAHESVASATTSAVAGESASVQTRCADGTLQSYVGTTCVTTSGYYTITTGPFLSLTVNPAFVNVTVGTNLLGDYVRYSGGAFAAGASEVRGMLDLNIQGYPGVIELSMLPGSGAGGVFVTLGQPERVCLKDICTPTAADVYYLSGSPPKAKLADWLYPSDVGWSGTLSWAVLPDETPGDVMLTISGSQ